MKSINKKPLICIIKRQTSNINLTNFIKDITCNGSSSRHTISMRSFEMDT